MKSGLIRLVVAGMMLSGVCAMAADVAPGAAPKAKESGKVLKGVLSAPATNAVAGVVAVLTHKEKDGDKTFNLTCTDADILAKIADGVAKNAMVIVHGEMSKDGTSLAVTKYEDKTAKHHEKPAAAAAAAPAPVAK